jgi:multidrug efflux pump subunit AcrA (membrane-fusion protein)
MFDMKPTHALIATCALLGLAMAPHVQSQDQDEPAYEVAQVTQGGFEAHATVQGRYAADLLGEVKFEAERYAGELKVAEVLVSHGNVYEGQAVLKLEAPDLAEQLTDAREALGKAKLRLDWAKKEAKIAEAERAVAAERRKLSLADTLSAHKRWDAFGKKDAYHSAELQMQSREDRYADEKQELKQLEELYDGAKLASRTQDVVLGRARRSLAQTEAYMEIARRQHKVTIEQTLPNQERDMDNQLRWMQADHANAAWRAEVAKIQQAWALEASQEAFTDAKEAVAELEKDAASLTIKAQEAGVMTALGLEPGDKVQANQALAKLYTSARGTLKANLSTKDLRVVQEGDQAAVTWDWFDELSTTGKVHHIAWQGQAGGAKDASYEVVIDVNDVAAMIRPGMTAKITVTKPLGDSTLSVPTEAVASDDQGAYCMVKVGDGFERRAVSTGASSDERLQIIKGLSAGESVRVPAK